MSNTPPSQQYVVSEPMARMAMDFIGPLRETRDGMKYILVIMDYFSKWAEAVAVKSTNAKTVARALLDSVFSRYGFPAELHSDQGSGFIAETVGELC